MLEVADVFARRRKDFDKTKAIPADGIVSCCVLLGVGDEESAPNVLDVERREAAWDALGALFVAVAITVGIERVFIEVNALEFVVLFYF